MPRRATRGERLRPRPFGHGKTQRKHGAWFLFLPPYSPDLNSIEMALPKLKAHLRRIGAGTIDALGRAVGQIGDLFEPQERERIKGKTR